MSIYLYAVRQFLMIPPDIHSTVMTPMLDHGNNPWGIILPVRSASTATNSNNNGKTPPSPTEAQTPLSKSMTTPRLECGNNNDENDDPEDLELLDKEMQDMVYWWDIPSDALAFPSSRRQLPKKQKQYLSFEPEDAGWNNKRMSFEMAMVLAHAMDRTIVLPPKRIISHFHVSIYSYRLKPIMWCKCKSFWNILDQMYTMYLISFCLDGILIDSCLKCM
jgi:hypothetical protein